MNLKALQTFHLVVREGSLAAAAAKLHLSPPAVSRLIRILEDETRLTLFSRARRRLSLTTEGELFFREAQHILEGVGEIPRIASDIRRRALAGVRVITSAPLAVSLVSPALAKLRAAHPLIRCVADIGSRFDLESMVGTRRYDLGIVSLPISHSLVELDASPLCRARAVAVIPASHPLAARARVTARDLRGQPMIALRPGQLWRERMDDFFRAGGIVPDYAIETRSTLVARQLALEGAGIAIMDRISGGTMRGDGMCAIPLEPQRWVHYGHVTPSGQVLDEEARLFVAALRGVVARLEEHGGDDALVVSESPSRDEAVPQAGAAGR